MISGMNTTEKAVLAVVFAVVLLGVYLSSSDPEYFRNRYTTEDGLLEWATVVALLIALAVCIRRLFLLWRVRRPRFRFMVCFLALLCLFGAGEELSWGQRILGFTTPAYFAEHNTQEEVGIHNLRFEIYGRSIKLNRLIFGVGLALGFWMYLFVMTPLYRKHAPFTQWLDSLAIPMPRNYHIISYLLLIAIVELLMDSSKRGEITEFAGSYIFLLNVTFPYNQHCFDRDNQELRK